MRIQAERLDREILETVRTFSYHSLASEAYGSLDIPRRAAAISRSDSVDFGTMQDLYGISENGVQSKDNSQDSENSQGSENSEGSETPGQVDSMPENTPANFNVETPSSGYADEAPESNSNPSHGVPDSDTVSTDTQPAPVASIAMANSTAFDPCCNVNTQQESVAPDPDGMNAEGEAEGSSTANDSANSNATGNDAEGGNSTSGTDGSNGSSCDGDGGGD